MGPAALAIEAHDTRAAEAAALFCYQAKKWIGDFAAALGGTETLVFAGEFGENAPLIRCANLGGLGLPLRRNRRKTKRGKRGRDFHVASRVTVRVIRTDEDLMMAGPSDAG